MSDDTPEPEYLDDTDTVLPEARAGQVIGSYRILQRVGEGGMGEVFEAEQLEPVRRRVALKVVKHGMDTRQVVARFESERQALAVMNHPNIASVYDAGSTERGRPFFAMEFVKGEPIHRYCDRYKLGMRERLELFIQVCDGVQHAHQKGIIHRDIKPSNVLVQIEGDTPVPKIIDFGVAKATAQRLAEETAHTELGQIIGTPEYMSPEQADLTLQDIDTRSDVYSLGVLLYELLVGTLPFASKELRRIGFDEFRRRVREDEPPRPSTRLTLNAESAQGTAARRGTDRNTLVKRLRGDLDWITMKAIEKDRTRRYGSPAELAEDIRRHVRNEPIQARPPSTIYRMGKFVRRHTFGVAAAAVLLLLLCIFAGTSFFQARRIAQERDRANQEAAAANQVTQVLSELFDLSDPGEALGKNITARELLDIGLGKVRSTLAGQPRELARSLMVIGENYRRLGMFERAMPPLEEALALSRSTFGAKDQQTLAAMVAVAGAYKEQGRYDEAQPLYRTALEGLVATVGELDPRTLNCRNDLAGLYWSQGRFEESERRFLEVLAARRSVLGDRHEDTAESLNDLGLLYRELERYDDAEKLLVAALRARNAALGPDHPDTLHTENNLALLYHDLGRYEEAEPLYLAVREKQRRVLGPDHKDTMTLNNNLAALYFVQDRYDEAEALYREGLASQRRLLGDEHPNTLGTMGNLGDLLTRQGRLREARPLLVAAVEGCRATLPEGHFYIGVNLRKYGCYLLEAAEYDAAEETLLEAHAILAATLGESHEQTVKAGRALVDLYERWGRATEAETWRSRFPADHAALSR